MMPSLKQRWIIILPLGHQVDSVLSMPNITDGAIIKYICWNIGENIQILHHGMETFLSGLESMLYPSLAGSGKNNIIY